MMIRTVCLLSIATILTACSVGTPGAPSSPGGGGKFVLTGDEKADWAQIIALENEAKALVNPDGCTSDGECRTAPVGSRGCGGPRYYLVYCSRTTDSAALYARLKVVADAEREYNTRYQIGSTCEFRMPPTVALTGGACQAQQPAR